MKQMRLKAGARHTHFDLETQTHRPLKAGEVVELSDEHLSSFGDKFEELDTPKRRKLAAGEECPTCGHVAGSEGVVIVGTTGLAEDAGAKLPVGVPVPGTSEMVDPARVDREHPGLRSPTGEVPAGAGSAPAGGSEAGGGEDQDAALVEGNVDEVKARVEKAKTKEELDRIEAAEQKGRARVGVIDAVDRRRSQIQG